MLEPIDRKRQDGGMLKLFPQFIFTEELCGLGEPGVVRVLESLPYIEHLNDYQFKFGRSPYIELPLAVNPSGCARAEPKSSVHHNVKR